MRERNIVLEIAIVGLLFLLVLLNGLTLLQNQSIEKRFIKAMDDMAAARSAWRSDAPESENHSSTQQSATNTVENKNDTTPKPPAAQHSPSYFDVSMLPKFPRGDENADDGDTLTINEGSEPNSWNFLIENDATVHDVWELGTDYLAKRVFGHPNDWEPKLARAWDKAMICRGIAKDKNAKELAAKLSAALSPADREKLKISKIEAESDEILRVELSDAVGDYREPVMKALGEGAIEQQHWLYITFEGDKFTDGTPIDSKSVAARMKSVIQSTPGFKARFLPDWLREGSVVLLMSGDIGGVEKTVRDYVASELAKGEVTDAKSTTGKSIKKVLSYESTEHYIFEEKPIYTFYLRKGVRWHDGHPFTGKDLIFSYEAMMNPKVEAEAQRNGYIDCESFKLVNGDPFTVQYVWKKPFFLSFANSCELFTLPEHIFHFSDGADFNKNPANQKLMGTGPYKLESYEPKQPLVLVRNDDYFGTKAHFKRIVVKFIQDQSAALLSLKNGDLDIMGLPKQKAHELFHDPAFLARFDTCTSTSIVYRYVAWNIRRDKFSSVKTRRALTMLIDRQRIIDKIYYNFAEPLDVPTHPESPSFPKNAEELRVPFNVEMAKQLLKEDGWADTDGDNILDKEFDGKRVPFKFTLMIQSNAPEYEAIANQIKDSFAQAGIDVTIRNLEWSVFLQNVDRLNFDALILGWQVGVADDPFGLWHSSQTGEKAQNFVGYVNKEVDQLIEEGRKELDAEKRNALFARVYSIVAKDQPYTCLFVEKRATAYDKRIRNVVFNFQGREFTRWWVPKELQKAK